MADIPHITILVNSQGITDSRVKKQALALAKTGYDVTVLCRNKKKCVVINKRLRFIGKPFLTPLELPNILIHDKRHWYINRTRLTALQYLLILSLPLCLLGLLSLLSKKIIPSIERLARRYLLPAYLYEVTCAGWLDDVIASKPDIIHAHDLDTLRLAVRANKYIRTKVIYDAHEFERDRNDRPYPAQKKQIIAEESKYIKEVNEVITVSPGIATRLRELYSIKKPKVIYNSPRINPDATQTIRQTLGLDDNTPLGVYVGLIREDRCLDRVAQALAFLPKWHWAFLGPTQQGFDNKLKQIATEAGLENRLHLLAPIADDEVVPFIADADIGIFVAEKICQSYAYALPNKIFEMSLAGLPLVVSDLPLIRKFCEDYKVGMVLTDPITPERIATLVETVYADRKQFNDDAKRRMIQQDYSWAKQSQSLRAIYQNLTPLFDPTITQVMVV